MGRQPDEVRNLRPKDRHDSPCLSLFGGSSVLSQPTTTKTGGGARRRPTRPPPHYHRLGRAPHPRPRHPLVCAIHHPPRTSIRARPRRTLGHLASGRHLGLRRVISISTSEPPTSLLTTSSPPLSPSAATEPPPHLHIHYPLFRRLPTCRRMAASPPSSFPSPLPPQPVAPA